MTTTCPARLVAFWKIFTPVIWVDRPVASMTWSGVVAGKTPVTFPAAVPFVAKPDAAMPTT